jgi:flavin-dependent dehydrogenase
MLAFHTDSDLPAAQLATQPAALLANAPANGEFAEMLKPVISSNSGQRGVTFAGSSVLRPCAGCAWFAVGDAAMTFDPLSGQGLLNALFTGLAAAEAVDRQLRGWDDALPGYLQTLAGIEAAYRRHLRTWYQGETRWPNAPFWQRRHSAECELAS